MKEIFLGVDGGGTKTSYFLENDGKKYEVIGKTLHLKQISRDEFLKRFSFAVESLCEKAKIGVEDITYSFIALPGFGQFPEDEGFIMENIRKTLKTDDFSVDNDCVNGWAGSLNAKPGINLVLGTGSIAFGIDEKGNKMSCGGWGYFVGDEGSGYYIGKQIINIFSKMSDGRYEKTLIYEKVKELMQLKDDYDIITKSVNMSRDEVASLSVILGDAIKCNDKYAMELLNDLTDEASLIINTLADKMYFEDVIKVSYSGGVFKLGNILVKSIQDKLNKNITIVSPFAGPNEGALILAKKIYKYGDNGYKSC